jgi:hypothetical protein
MERKKTKKTSDSSNFYEFDKSNNSFSKWLDDNNKNYQYYSYLSSLVKFLENSNLDLDNIFKKMELAIQKKGDTIKRLNDLYNKLNKAATMAQNFEGKETKLYGITPKTIDNYCVALNCYIDYLDDAQDSDKYQNWGAKDWDKNLKDFWKNMLGRFQKDGYSSLLSVFCKNEKDNPNNNEIENLFVKLAVENSYFFSKRLVKEQHEYIKSLLNPVANKSLEQSQNDNRLYARKSTDANIQEISKKKGENGEKEGFFKVGKEIKIPIWIDSDGNKEVRDLIANKTGFTVSSGYDNFFVNFKISHIWGNAFDPRFFTSLWNIVLVPSWANDLLDKHGSEMPLAQKMINTYKVVCEELYGAVSLGNQLGVNPTFNPNYVVHRTYEVNVLNNTSNGTIGTIKKVRVTV